MEELNSVQMSRIKQEKERLLLLDLEYGRIRRGTKCTGWSVDMQNFREVGRTRTGYSMKARACNFVLDAFCNGKSVQFLQEECVE